MQRKDEEGRKAAGRPLEGRLKAASKSSHDTSRTKGKKLASAKRHGEGEQAGSQMVRGGLSRHFERSRRPRAVHCACTFSGCLRQRTTVPTRRAPSHATWLGARQNPVRKA